MLDIAIFGAPEEFETEHLAVLRQFASRARIAGLYDPVPFRRTGWIKNHKLPCYGGIYSLLQHESPKAVLILSEMWQLDDLPRMMNGSERVLFLGQKAIPGFLQRGPDFHKALKNSALTIVPELQLRYWPSIIRAQELSATKVGKLQQIEILAGSPDQLINQHLQLCDLIFHLLRISIQRCSVQYEHTQSLLSIMTPGKSDRPRSARLTSEPADSFLIRLHCENGFIEINGERQLHWDWEKKRYYEELTEDRAPGSVLIDHFLRRSAGGLIPVPDWNHLILIHSQLQQLSLV